jgi:hypothetical protein
VPGQFALGPAEVAAYGQPLEFQPACLSFRTVASVVATWSMSHTSTVAYPRRVTTPGGAERLAWAGEDAPILSDRQVQELLETDLSEDQCCQLDAIPPLLWDRLRAAAEMAIALRVGGIARVGLALPAEAQARAAHLAGLGTRIRPALCLMLLAEVLATGTGVPQRPTARAQVIHAQTVRRVVSSTAPKGTYTLGHLGHYQGGRGSNAALRSMVGADADVGGRFGPAGPLSLPALPGVDDGDDEGSEFDDEDEPDPRLAAALERMSSLRQSYALLLEEAHDSRAVVGGLHADFG